ncbi:hypothetical protein ACFQ3N_11970 [Virgibacillus byunsanensis]|uniref:Uncharacterized protein n=1 Tax=Virgibacillus byunsanensis TaxID=570945 RepID=A0ABW3LPB0_9BACI
MGEFKKRIERGQSITFRVPSDTPDYLLKQLQNLKETERRNFSSEIAQYVLKGVNESYSKERETITVPLPKQLTKEQKNWLKHAHSETLIGSIMYQLLQDPMRATSLMASLNSGSRDGSLYVQEDKSDSSEDPPKENVRTTNENTYELNDIDLENLQDDLLEQPEQLHEKEEEDPLSDFFSSMNK